MSGDILQEAFTATVSRDYEKAVSVIREVLSNSSNHSFSVEQLELIDHVYSCILNTSHYDESLIEVCWEWIDAIERSPRTVDTRAISSSQLSIYYAYHTICRVQERMPRKVTHSQLRQETWSRVTHSFRSDLIPLFLKESKTCEKLNSWNAWLKGGGTGKLWGLSLGTDYLWAAATQLWKPHELDRLDILCSWSYLCLQFADVVTEEVLKVVETAKETSKELLANVVVIENGHQANQRLLTVERNIRDSRAFMEKLGKRFNEASIKSASTVQSSEPVLSTESILPPNPKKWCGNEAIGRERS